MLVILSSRRFLRRFNLNHITRLSAPVFAVVCEFVSWTRTAEGFLEQDVDRVIFMGSS